MRLKTTPFIKLRSELHNLKGIVALDRNEIDEAVVAFEDALHDDPSSVVARLNLAFALVQIDEYQHAIDATAFVTDPWLWPATSDPALLSTAYIIRGAARWGQQDLTAAMHDFEYAAYLQPTSTAANWYWSRLLRLRGDPDEADKKLEVARDNLSYFETYPELALLYFWVSEQDQRPLERRTNDFPSWSGSSDADPASSTAPGATPTAPTSSHSRT